MAQEKKAAMDLDAIGEKHMGEISASDFLAALDAGGVTLRHVAIWPEKKKVELWVEPESYGRFRVKDIILVFRNEKKKLELEKFPGLESWRDPRELIYEDLLGRLTRDIEGRFRLGR